MHILILLSCVIDLLLKFSVFNILKFVFISIKPIFYQYKFKKFISGILYILGNVLVSYKLIIII